MTEIKLIQNIYKSGLSKNLNVLKELRDFLLTKKKKFHLSLLENMKIELLSLHAQHKLHCNPNKPCSYEGVYKVLLEVIDSLIEETRKYIPWYMRTWVRVTGLIAVIAGTISIPANFKKLTEDPIQKTENFLINSNNTTLNIVNVYVSNNPEKLEKRTSIEKQIKPLIYNSTKLYIDKINYIIRDDGKAVANLNSSIYTSENIGFSLSFSERLHDTIKEYNCNSLGVHNEQISLFIKGSLLFKSEIEVTIIDRDTICGLIKPIGK